MKYAEEVDKINFINKNVSDALIWFEIRDGVIGRFLDMNEAAINLLGYPKLQLVKMTPFDLIDINKKKLKSYSKKLIEENEAIDFFEHKSASGKELKMGVIGKVFEYEDGKICLCIVNDVRNKFDTNWLEAYKQIFENNTEAVIITDKNGNVEWTNQKFTEITKYSREDVIGKTTKLMKSHKHNKEFYDDMWQSILTKGSWNGEIWNRKKDGELYPSFVNIYSIKDKNGEVLHFVAVERDISDKKKTEEDMFKLAYIDPLTELPNRNYIEEELQKMLDNEEDLSVALVHIDNFRQLNDTLGFNTGDNILRYISKRIDYISGPQNEVSRVGSYEFMVLAKENKTGLTMVEIAESIIDEFKEAIYLDEYQIYISISIGIVNTAGNKYTAKDVFKNADIAMNSSKKTKMDSMEVYTEVLEALSKKEFELENDIFNAIENREFELYYQPIVDLNIGEVVGAEALLRWKHPKYGFINPEKFIGIAERTGFIITLGEWVIREGCMRLAKWKRMGHSDKSLAINISTMQLEQKDFVEMIKNIFKEMDVTPDRVKFEITESISVSDFIHVRDILDQFSAIGVKWSMDDFGTGYSSLKKLKQLSIDILKIDKSFIMDINKNIHDTLIATTIIGMAKNLGLSIIAEGVETIDQMMFLRNQKCDYAQGYLFSKPVPAREFERILSKRFDTVMEFGVVNKREEDFKALYERAPMGYFVLGREGKITMCNAPFLEMIEYEKEDVIGKSITEFIPEKEVNTVYENFKTYRKDGNLNDFQISLVTKTNRILDVLIDSKYSLDGDERLIEARCLVKDITESIKEEKELMRQREIYRRIFKKAPLAFIVWDSDYKILDWNEHAREIFGWAREEAIGKNIFDLIVKKCDYEELKKTADKLLSGKSAIKINKNITKQGREILCEWTNEIIKNDSNKVDTILSIARDITKDR